MSDMPHTVYGLVTDLRRELAERDDDLGERLDEMASASSAEHKATNARLTALERAGTAAKARADGIVQLARCAVHVVTICGVIVGVLAATGVI